MGKNETCSWHDGKQETNLAQHKYDFADLAEIFDGRFAIVRRDSRFDYGERRFNMIVEFQGRIMSVTFHPRDGKFHLISARPASRKERKVHDEQK